jgi:hypothetical protein
MAEKTAFNMSILKHTLEAVGHFQDDMQGGIGYKDAMRQYA